MFVYKLSDCRFESRCSHLNFRYGACFKQGVLWHLGNYKVRIHSETRTWHDKNIQSNAPYRYVLTTQLNHLASLAKWLSVRLRTKWLWVWGPLQSQKAEAQKEDKPSLTKEYGENVDLHKPVLNKIMTTRK